MHSFIKDKINLLSVLVAEKERKLEELNHKVWTCQTLEDLQVLREVRSDYLAELEKYKSMLRDLQGVSVVENRGIDAATGY